MHICRTTSGLAPDVGVWLWVALAVSALACTLEVLLSRHLCLKGRLAVEGLSEPLLSSQTDTEPPKKDFHATIWGLLRLSSACSPPRSSSRSSSMDRNPAGELIVSMRGGP